MRKREWNTYATTAYTHQVGTDPRATGGVHHHEVRKTLATWQRRIVDSNGNWESPGPTIAITSEEGEALFNRARLR